ncbi:hypothetical protein RF11_14461 [Thelohanellus kitauei]|uniref:Uncharacterized protein n=1 Tax=Thelohanellus kitauei TaxID=669202 RepID=A0A0C2MJS1_THEKT|nr:hypothetical protein RF11_14461 [Thelohanellus kitauei]
MGTTIASIGNEEYIKRCFYKLNFEPDRDINTFNSSVFPSTVWSIGFVYPFGGWFGSIIGGYCVDRYGRYESSELEKNAIGILLCARYVRSSPKGHFQIPAHSPFVYQQILRWYFSM